MNLGSNTKVKLPVLLAGLAAALLVLVIFQARVIYHLRANGYLPADAGTPSLSGLSYQISARSDGHVTSYVITMTVKDGRAFTMPVLFTQNGRPVRVPPSDAKGFADQWMKTRAIGLAEEYTRMDSNGHPFLPIAVEQVGRP